ncbi:hypothetical protein Mmc1_1924 [Magnetococcus marinus MC-1]|uniref:Uncharacterized protein n=1 Tax=Magnetococcus marinus (strain ATCC BAA-1437 / JCM 17883 / MC-1) TaxID=156889 RepID=A0L8Y9_MAGMM|nr:hypothetical protein [Magnetococcus marinus]ABK44432.1 hypothetical protein Mmc1_1924 [Magnetococcus marinus MC-1]
MHHDDLDFPRLQPELHDAFLKLRQKSCVPSYLWQHLRQTPSHAETQPLLMRRTTLQRIEPYLALLQQHGFISGVRTTPHGQKKGLSYTIVEGVSPDFQQVATALFPHAML